MHHSKHIQSQYAPLHAMRVCDTPGGIMGKIWAVGTCLIMFNQMTSLVPGTRRIETGDAERNLQLAMTSFTDA